MHERHAQSKVGGVSANALVVPIAIVLVILHVMIVSLILMINITSNDLSSLSQKSGVITQDATSLLAGSSLLSETSNNFVLRPVTSGGEINTSPLAAYATELGEDRRGSQVVERLRGYGVPEDQIAVIEVAANSANSMLEDQLHAISLIRSVYPIPEVEPFTAIPAVPLTDAELAMSDEEKCAEAAMLLLSQEYGRNKGLVSQSTNAFVEQIRGETAQRAAETGRRMGILRAVMWAVTLSIIAILVLIFIALYRQILFPLDRFVKTLPLDKPLDEGRGIREVRMVASAYNEVLKRRDALDGILRSAAERDTLTNLPNRYRFEQYLLESGESGYSMAMLLFDINYLKVTNDTKGHLAGDKLIRAAADCIAACFGDEEVDNCFRFGGDEFAAVLKHCTPASIRERIDRFEAMQKEKRISISLGYAYAKDIGKTTFRKLVDEADRNMYAYKKIVHEQA